MIWRTFSRCSVVSSTTEDWRGRLTQVRSHFLFLIRIYAVRDAPHSILFDRVFELR